MLAFKMTSHFQVPFKQKGMRKKRCHVLPTDDLENIKANNVRWNKIKLFLYLGGKKVYII